MFKAFKDGFAAGRARNEVNRRSMALNEDENLIAEQVPEVSGLGFVHGSAFVLSEIRKWRETASQDELAEFGRLLQVEQASWTKEGFSMPWWSDLKVLRNYQAILADDRSQD